MAPLLGHVTFPIGNQNEGGGTYTCLTPHKTTSQVGGMAFWYCFGFYFKYVFLFCQKCLSISEMVRFGIFFLNVGTGKTLIARALASECCFGSRKVSFFIRKGADLLSKWVGESEKQLRLLFEQVRSRFWYFVWLLRFVLFLDSYLSKLSTN